MPTRRKLRAADLGRLKLPTGVTLSPDGTQIVYALKGMDAERNRYWANLHLVPVRTGRSRQLTRGPAIDGNPAWSPNGRRLAFTSKRTGKLPQVWILPLDGGEPWQLTRLKGGPIRNLQWSPDGRALLFEHRSEPHVDPEKRKLGATYKHITRVRHKLDGDGWFPPERWHIYKVTVPGGRITQLTQGENDESGAIWSPNGRKIAFISNRIAEADYHPENGDLYTISPSGRALRQVTKRFGPVAQPAWSLDGKRLYYVGHFGGDGEMLRYPLHIYAIAAGGGTPTDLTPKLDQWPANYLATDTASPGLGYGRLMPYRCPERGKERLAYFLNEHGACRLYSIPGRGGAPRVELGGAVDLLYADVRAETGEAALAGAQIMDCGEIYTLMLDGGDAPQQRTHINRTVLHGLNLTEPEEMIFGTARNKNVPVHGWVIKPPGFRAGKRYPLILYIHGGPMAQYGYVFVHELHYLAAQGYVVAYTNPRGSSGYGLRFMNCILNRWGTDDYDDLMAVVDTMARKPYVDGKRLGVAGGSYGGFMTTWMVGHTNRFKAAVTQRQASNMLIQVGSSDFGFYRTYLRGSTPLETPMKHLKDSPNYYADKIRTPLLIVHSENDLRCPIGQSEELFTFLKLHRREVEMIRFEGESHGLSRGGKPQNRLERLRRISGWFKRYL